MLTKRNVIKFDEKWGEYSLYSLADAISELMAPKLGRAYFDVPTLPPTEFVERTDGLLEVRQFFIKGEEKDTFDAVFGEDLGYEAKINGQSAFHFILNLARFEEFIGADDRNLTNLLFVSQKTVGKEGLDYSAFAIDFAETYYVFREDSDSYGIVNEDNVGDLTKELFQIPHLSSLSIMQKLSDLYYCYESLFGQAKKLAPDLYNSHYFSTMKEWQYQLLGQFQGYTFDDREAAFWIMISSHKLNSTIEALLAITFLENSGS